MNKRRSRCYLSIISRFGIIVLAVGACGGAVFGLWGCSAAPAQSQPLGPLDAMLPAGQVDCSALAATPNSPMSIDACRQLMNSAKQSEAALKDTRGARPGDEAMSCQDIAKEMGTMQGIGLSEASRAEGNAAATQYQAVVGSQMAQLHAQGVAGATATTAAAAADLATQFASGGLVNPHAAQAVQQAALAAGRVQGERMAEERRPTEQRLFNATGNNTGEMAQQLQSNPRFARLVNLAIAKGCREPGDSATSPPLQMPQGMSPIGH
jgi:hypothetical protein